MELTATQRRKFRISLWIISFGIGAGLFFVALSDGIKDWYPLLNGALIGLIIAILASIFELNIYEKSIRKNRFIVVLLVRSLFYLIVIIAVFILEIGIARMIKEDLDLAGLLQNADFRNYFVGGEFSASVIYTLSLVLIINFTRQVSRKLGHGVMESFITGRYYHPVKLRKIFMFLNIPDSEAIVARIGRMQFHRFINDIAYDITLPILSNHGIIYQYVEDEMVITWELNEGISHARAICCFFDIKDKIHQHRDRYSKKYDAIPLFNAALHCGEVVKGEIGFIKSEIVYHGDVLNSTSRILEACNHVDNELLVSSQLLNHIALPGFLKASKCGNMKLKGKKHPIELYSIQRLNDKPVTA